MNQNESNDVVLVLFADRLNCAEAEPLFLDRIGTLPPALRTMLSAARAGVTRFAAAVRPAWNQQVKKALENTGRMPPGVEWLDLPAGEASFGVLLSQIVEWSPDRLVLAQADRVFHPSLVERAVEETGTEFVVFTNGNQPVGLYALPGKLLLDVIDSVPREIRTLEELCHWLASARRVRFETVEGQLWHAIERPQDLPQAEQKLNRWLYKKTDGIFARLNRRISIPISRQLIKIPITPNMVTIATLGISAVSGVFFALGGYVHMLIGAVFSWAASVLDGCDGEVARLTHQESDFGCWLETVCEYAYYLFVFTGMTIGLWRTHGSVAYPALGALLLFGAAISFLATGLQRHRLAGNRPENYLTVWQQQAGRQRDLLLWIGRHVEFVIRRSFLPYAFLFFAVCGLPSVAFIMCAFGANLVWLITLRSNRFLRAPRSPRDA